MEKPNTSKQKMQDVRFHSIEEFLDYLPEEELGIVQFLRKIVIDALPNMEEYLAYNVPYYRLNAPICFIWPSSILWGKKKTYQGVRFGFTKGYLLQDEINYLDKGNRKQVYWKDFLNVPEAEEDILKAFLFEAMEIDLKKAKSTIQK